MRTMPKKRNPIAKCGSFSIFARGWARLKSKMQRAMLVKSVTFMLDQSV